MKRLLTLALCAAGFVLLTAASDYLRGTRALTINGRPFGNAVLVNGVWSVPLDDVEKNIDAKFTVLGNRLEIARDPASGLPTGKRMHKPFVITKELDKSSVILFQTGGKSYLALSDLAKLLGGTFNAPAKDDRPTESLSLNFTKIEYSH